MGMIVTLYLISANVYNSVDAPPDRGFSYIEIWMIGTQLPILFAICEYGLILHWRRIGALETNNDNKGLWIFSKNIQIYLFRIYYLFVADEPTKMKNISEAGLDLEKKIKDLDYISMIFSLVYLITSVLVYWIIAYN